MKAIDSKSIVGVSLPGVRIPLSPPVMIIKLINKLISIFDYDRQERGSNPRSPKGVKGFVAFSVLKIRKQTFTKARLLCLLECHPSLSAIQSFYEI